MAKSLYLFVFQKLFPAWDCITVAGELSHNRAIQCCVFQDRVSFQAIPPTSYMALII